MLDLIKRALSKPPQEEKPSAGESAERVKIAAAVVLMEAAGADNECTDEELAHAIDTLKSGFGVSEEYARELLEMAEKEKERAVDLFEFTNRINNGFSREEKLGVLDAVWRIIHADGVLEKHEDYFARKLTNLLRLDHRDMIDAKLRTKEGR